MKDVKEEKRDVKECSSELFSSSSFRLVAGIELP